jgi:putative hemolysin
VIAETGCEESGTCECPDGYVCEQFWRDIDHGVCFPTQ